MRAQALVSNSYSCSAIHRAKLANAIVCLLCQSCSQTVLQRRCTDLAFQFLSYLFPFTLTENTETFALLRALVFFYDRKTYPRIRITVRFLIQDAFVLDVSPAAPWIVPPYRKEWPVCGHPIRACTALSALSAHLTEKLCSAFGQWHWEGWR